MTPQPPTNEQTETIHRQYKALTGLDIPYTMQIRFVWEAWLVRGWTESDLACAVRYIKRRINDRRMEKESLLIRNLISRTDNFAETLAISRATARNERTETPKQEILRAIGKPSPQGTPARTVGNVMDADKAFQAFKAWREAEGL